MGFLVFCSNNSKNGPVDDMINAANAMFEDAHLKFAIDKNRSIASGFSGGARFALFLALHSDVFEAVIACGAGQPASGDVSSAQDLLFCGIVGDEDFNFAEMFEFKAQLENLFISNNFSVFHGAHDWPPSAEIEQAMLWIRLQEMKQNKAPLDETIVNRYELFMDSLYATFISDGDLINATRALHNWQLGVAGLAPVNRPAGYLKRLEADQNYNSSMDEYKHVLATEVEKKQQFLDAFSLITLPVATAARPESWWQTEIDDLQDQAVKPKRFLASSARRLLSMLAVNGYYASRSMYESGRYEKAKVYTDIWILAEPDSRSAHLMSARLYILLNDPNKAVRALELAVDLGVAREEIKADSLFVRLADNKKFIELMNRDM